MRNAWSAAALLALLLAACAPPSPPPTANTIAVLSSPLAFDAAWAPSRVWSEARGGFAFFYYNLVSTRPTRTATVFMQHFRLQQGNPLAATAVPIASPAAAVAELVRFHSIAPPSPAAVVAVPNALGTAYVFFGPQEGLWCGWLVQYFDASQGVIGYSCRTGSSLGDQAGVRNDILDVLAGMRLRS